MTIKSDRWIQRMAETQVMISPFEAGQIRERDGEKLIGSEYIGEEASPHRSQNQITGAFDTPQDDIKQLSQNAGAVEHAAKGHGGQDQKDGVQHARESALVEQLAEFTHTFG